VNDAIILGSCIPQVPGLPKAKTAIPHAKENDLRGRKKRGANGKKKNCMLRRWRRWIRNMGIVLRVGLLGNFVVCELLLNPATVARRERLTYDQKRRCLGEVLRGCCSGSKYRYEGV
jgi:hypothetical protein